MAQTLDEILEDLFAKGMRTERVIRKDHGLPDAKKMIGDSEAAIKAWVKEQIIGEDEKPPVGEMGKFDPVTQTYELITDTEAVKYHMQRVMNRNDFRKELRTKIDAS